ncbi:MAG: HPr kinase/phosphatase C-terminal domain-containing protein [Alphaproteobacteria bacterium]|nr:HPr kinase/phosphatase C-terminal domain-containing protein [Alphaproteobacteria bacterium]
MIMLYAASVDYKGSGILIMGISGSGKSDLALRLIGRGAKLVSDDQTEIKAEDGVLFASPPEIIKGLIEVRGLGLAKIEHVEKTPIRLVIELTDKQNVERLPEKDFCEIQGVNLRKVALDPFEASTVEKVLIALDVVTGKTELASD